MRVGDFRAFVANASATIKAAAPRQLVCTGMEGDTAWFSRGQATLLTQQASKIDFVTARRGRYSPRLHIFLRPSQGSTESEGGHRETTD